MSFLILSLLGACIHVPALAQGTIEVSTSTSRPVYLALIPNINDFDRFADGGPDGSWYVGFNNASIVKLPPAPQGDFARAFIGAKIGRTKTKPLSDRPWLREMIEGKIYIAISQTPAFTSEQSYFLADTRDISAEPDRREFTQGVGPGQWFWTEVPLNHVSSSQSNYLIIWSPTEYFLDASSSPVLAAAALSASSSREALAWNNHSISGVPPRSGYEALETPVRRIAPAMAIKLVPAGAKEDVSILDFSFDRTSRGGVASFSASGRDVAEAWVESSRDQLDWRRVSRILRGQPFVFTLNPEQPLGSGVYLRGVAVDAAGNVGTSAPFQIPF